MTAIFGEITLAPLVQTAEGTQRFILPIGRVWATWGRTYPRSFPTPLPQSSASSILFSIG